MQKDYMPGAPTQGNELEFVEAFWTDKWNTPLPNDSEIDAVGTKEEYRVIKPYLDYLPPAARILDGGCGLGRWSLFLARRGYNVIGIDVSRRTIERLQAQFTECEFVVGDIRNTGFAEASFDGYFSWGTFEHFECGLGPCFREARRILKAGGYLFVSVPFQNARHLRLSKKPLEESDEHFEGSRGYSGEMRFYQWRLTRPELQREFEMNGFEFLGDRAIHKTTGLRRMVKHDLKIGDRSMLHKAAIRVLNRLVSRATVAHMILGIGRKR